MRFCAECGQKLDEKETFCPECGTKVGEVSGETTSQVSAGPSKKNSDSFAFLKKNKLLVSIGLSVAVILLAGYLLLSHLNSPDRFVNGFLEDVEEEDYEALANQMYFSDTGENLTALDVEIYLGYLNESQNRIDDMKRNLNRQVEMMSEDKSAFVVDSISSSADNYYGSGEMFIVVEEAFLNDSYAIYVVPSYMTINASLDGLTLIDGSGETLHTFTENVPSFEVGPIVRGTHNFTFSYTGDWMTLEEEIPYYISSTWDQWYPSFDLSYITFEQPFDHGQTDTLFVNGTEVENPNFNEEMGPFLLDEESTYEYTVDFPWGTMSTGEHMIDNRSWISLDLVGDEALFDQLAEATTTFYDNVLESFVTYDLSILDDLNASFVSSFSYDFDRLHRYKELDADRHIGMHYGSFLVENRISDIGFNQNSEFMISVPLKQSLWVIDTRDANIPENYREASYIHDFIFRDGEWILVDQHTYWGSVDEDNAFTYEYDGEIRYLDGGAPADEEDDSEEDETDEDEDSDDSESDEEDEESEEDES